MIFSNYITFDGDTKSMNIKGDVVSDGHTLTTDMEVLEMLNQRCEMVDGSESGITDPAQYSCKNVCSKKRADLVCTFGIGTFKANNSTLGDQKVVVRSCLDRTSPVSTYLSCMCCHDP